MEALRCLTNPENIAMFEKYGVYNRRELESRYEVFLEDYHRRIKIEGEIALEIAESMIRPTVTAEFSRTAGALDDNDVVLGGEAVERLLNNRQERLFVSPVFARCAVSVRLAHDDHL